MNLFGMMETSGSAMQAERMRAEVVAANMANAETTRTATGGPYRRQEVVFAADQGDAGFLDSMDAAANTDTRHGVLPQLCRSFHCRERRRRRRECISRRWSRTHRHRSSATIPGIPTPDRMGMSPIPTLIPSQRWWT